MNPWPHPRPASATWEVFEACHVCGAPAGRTCVVVRTGHARLFPHPGRARR